MKMRVSKPIIYALLGLATLLSICCIGLIILEHAPQVIVDVDYGDKCGSILLEVKAANGAVISTLNETTTHIEYNGTIDGLIKWAKTTIVKVDENDKILYDLLWDKGVLKPGGQCGIVIEPGEHRIYTDDRYETGPVILFFFLFYFIVGFWILAALSDTLAAELES